jgi:hypothetical protein
MQQPNITNNKDFLKFRERSENVKGRGVRRKKRKRLLKKRKRLLKKRKRKPRYVLRN